MKLVLRLKPVRVRAKSFAVAVAAEVEAVAVMAKKNLMVMKIILQ